MGSFAPRAHLAKFETFFVVVTREEFAPGIYWVETGGAPQHPTAQPPIQRIMEPQMYVDLRLGHPGPDTDR